MASTNLIVGNDGNNTLDGTSGQDLIYGFNPDGPQAQVSTITATRVATGLSQTLFATAPAGDLGRLFIVEKTGQVYILNLDTNQVLPTAFVNLASQISTAGEGGLLGLAFDPNFAQNGYFYVNLINTSGDTEIRRYQVSSGNANVANPATVTKIITIDQPIGVTNHKAGWLGFGPDGYLYAALGDGGGGGDPFQNGQNLGSLLAKMLRLDVRTDGFPADPNRNYAIPGDNPFVGVAGAAPEIWALGLRNPYRDSFDRGLGTLYIADVGQDTWEEIDIGQAGANYGWNPYEGPATYAGGTLGGGTLTFPIHSYNHTVGHSITGGYVYRGTSDGLQGQYFFADFVDNKVFTLRYNGSTWVATDRTSQIVENVGTLNSPSSFGEDGRGDLYVVDFDGDVFRLSPVVNSADLADTLRGLGGNDMLYGGAAGDLLDGGQGSDILNGGSGFDYAVYASASTAVMANLAQSTLNTGDAAGDTYILIEGLSGSAFNDSLTGNSSDNALIGGAGNDILVGGGLSNTGLNLGAGNDMLDGSIGVDIAGYTTAFRQSVLSGSPLATATLSGPDGNDTLVSIESLKFLDGIRSYDAGAHVWQANRLYGTAFERAPDVLGLNYHSARLDTGIPLASAADDFALSAEFLGTYGNINNSAFVNQLYLNALSRPADAGGLAYWTGLLNSGTPRGSVLAGLSDSPESIGNYAALLSGGLWDIDETAASVARLYWGTLDRAPDAAGLTSWTGLLNSGAQTLQQAAAVFVGSAEFQAAYGSLNNSAFVNQLYLNALDRPADAGGLAYWTGLLNAGTPRANVTLGFTESFEFQVNMLGQIDNGILVI